MTFENFLYALARIFFRTYLFLYHRIVITWAEPLPKDRNVILASNHCSNLDPIVVGVSFPRRLRYFAKEELFRPFFFGRLIRILGARPVSRSDNMAAAGALKAFFKLLEEGNDVLIFPEGSRSPDGKLMPLEGGVGLIAAHSRAAVLPVFVKGTHKAMPPGSSIPRPEKITVTFGKLIEFDEDFYRTKGARDKITAALTDALKGLEVK